MQQRPGPGVRWLGHATCVLDVDGVRLVTDPVLRQRLGVLRRHAAPVPPAQYRGTDVVLLSHLHRDHLDVPSLRLLAGARVVAPAGAGRLLRAAGIADVVELAPGERTAVGGVEVEAVSADHDGRRQPVPGSPRAAAVGYVVHATTRVYFAGDTALHEGMADLRGRVDVALLPVGGWGLTLGPGHMDPAQAAEAARRIRPRVAVPVHWGTLRPAGLMAVRPDLHALPGRRFQTAVARLAPEVHVAVPAPGEALDPAVLAPDGDRPAEP
jgi:L-ascorbate metabolism protein UlaG (beta-lactamase superfamily)